MVKDAFYKTLSHHPIQRRIFVSVTKRIQSMLNERPLCPSPDEQDQWTLTPAHFLRANLGAYTEEPEIPIELLTPTARTLTKYMQLDHTYCDQVWEAWKHLYLTYLRDKIPTAFPNAYRTSTYTPCVGDIVHVLDFKTKFGYFKMAKIIGLIPSDDGQIRHVEIEFPSGKLSSRPVKFLAPLECADRHSEVIRTHYVRIGTR